MFEIGGIVVGIGRGFYLIPKLFITISRDARRRLTSTKFLPIYKKIIRTDGHIHLKTDSDELYAFTKETLLEIPSEICKDYNDVYALKKNEELHGIQTYYEKMHLLNKRTIKYLCFKLV